MDMVLTRRANYTQDIITYNPCRQAAGDRDPAARVRDEAGERPIFPCCLPTYVAPRHISCAKILRTDGIVLGILCVPWNTMHGKWR